MVTISPLPALAVLHHAASPVSSRSLLLCSPCAIAERPAGVIRLPAPKSINGYNFDPVVFEKFQQPIRNKPLWVVIIMGSRGCCKLFGCVLYLACQGLVGHGSP